MTQEVKDNPWLDAHMDALMYGTGLVLVKNDGTAEHIPREKYMEMADALKWAAEKQEVKE